MKSFFIILVPLLIIVALIGIRNLIPRSRKEPDDEVSEEAIKRLRKKGNDRPTTV